MNSSTSQNFAPLLCGLLAIVAWAFLLYELSAAFGTPVFI
jgi:hypothetical protein